VCQKVSSDWEEIINFYPNSKNPRIKQIHKKTLNQEKLQGNPILETFELPGGAPCCQTFHHLTMDERERELVVVGLFSKQQLERLRPTRHSHFGCKNSAGQETHSSLLLFTGKKAFSSFQFAFDRKVYFTDLS
jgi:hypothetical protein